MSYIGTNFILSLDPDEDCGSIRVEDKTSYPYSGNTRDDVAIAIFYSLDGFTSVEGMDLSNNEEWIIEAHNTNTQKVRGYMVPKWSGTATYNAGTNGMIVWNNNAWYRQVTDVPSGEPGSYGSNGWTEITESEGGDTIEGYFDTACYSGSQDFGYTEASIYLDCPPFALSRTDCHQWTITKSSSITVSDVVLSKYDGTELSDDLEFSGDSLGIDLEDYDQEDGVFVVKIVYTGEARSQTASLAIIDFCDMEDCYKKAFRYMLCKCVDPCDEDCAELNNITQRRNDIELMYALYHSIMQYIYMDRYKNMGIMHITSERFDTLSEVGLRIEKLNEIVIRCGICDDDETNDVEC